LVHPYVHGLRAWPDRPAHRALRGAVGAQDLECSRSRWCVMAAVARNSGRSRLRVAVVGAGMGGLTAAAALGRVGLDATVYEQAGEFSRVGAGIHVAANAVKVLLGLGLPEQTLNTRAFINSVTMHRRFDTGEVTGTIDHGEESVRLYGAPYTTWHRGDLHEALLDLVPAAVVQRGRKVIGVEVSSSAATLKFADGSAESADVIIASDGVHSPIRDELFEAPPPRFTQRVAYRAVVSREAVADPDLDESCKWWGPDRHLVHYYVSGGREIAFTTSVPDPTWHIDSWSATGDVRTLREEFSAFHPRVRRILDAVEQVHRWAIYAHDPLPTWHAGPVVLIGDACHTTTPYM